MDTVTLPSPIATQAQLACAIATTWSASSPPTGLVTASSSIAPSVTLRSSIELETA